MIESVTSTLIGNPVRQKFLNIVEIFYIATSERGAQNGTRTVP